jgi:hypothetical protein
MSAIIASSNNAVFDLVRIVQRYQGCEASSCAVEVTVSVVAASLVVHVFIFACAYMRAALRISFRDLF